MAARGMAAEVEPAGVAAKARRVAIDPGDAAPHLLGDHPQIAVRALDADKIEDDVNSAGIDECLGRKGGVFGLGGLPAATVNKDEYRRISLPCRIDVELLDRGRAVCAAQRLQAVAHLRAQGCQALD